MCDIVYDEMSGQIAVMQNVLENMFKIYCEGDKEKLRDYCIVNRNTVNHIYYFHEALYENGKTTDIKELFDEIKCYLTVSDRKKN